MKKNNGITLIALMITIIVLLILAGIVIAMLSGENGILNEAVTSSRNTEIAKAKESIKLDICGKELEEEISYKDLEKILEQYGTVTYEDEEKTKPNGVLLKEYSGYKILLSDFWNGTVVPPIEEPEGNIKLMFNSTQDISESSNKLDYENITKILHTNTNTYKTDYKIQKVWFTDSSAFPLKFIYNKKKKYSDSNTPDITNDLKNSMIQKVIQSGRLEVKVEGLNKTENNYNIKWNDPIKVNFKIVNTGNMAAKTRLAIQSVGSWDENMKKYLKIKITGQGETTAEYSLEDLFNGDGVLFEINIEPGVTKTYPMEIQLKYE